MRLPAMRANRGASGQLRRWALQGPAQLHYWLHSMESCGCPSSVPWVVESKRAVRVAATRTRGYARSSASEEHTVWRECGG